MKPNNYKSTNKGSTYQTESNSEDKITNRKETGFDIQNPTAGTKLVKLSRIFLSSFLVLISLNSLAQEKNWVLNGYVKYLGMYYHPKVAMEGIDAEHLASSLLHNRLNFKWYASNSLTMAVEARNRLIFGQIVNVFPEYESMIDVDDGYFNLSRTLISRDKWFLHSIVDRAWIDYSSGDWQIRVGRQRINWGVNLVWNPNDIFNSFSYFDFDYEERPGSDAVKIQYFTGVTSSAELVYKIGENSNQTAIAGIYRFSKWNYDIQFLGGWMGKDYVVGGGWAGDIEGAGFRGEVSYFTPRKNENGSAEALVASVSADYSFTNSLYLHLGAMYNSHGVSGKAGGRSFFDQNLSAKMLSMARYSVYGQCSFPISPLFTTNFMAILNPSDGSSFIGPSFTYSLGDNLELMVSGQLFFGKPETEYGDYGQAVFGRLKWAF